MNEPLIRRAVTSDAPILVDFNRRMAEETEGVQLDPLKVTPGVLAALQEDSGAAYYVAEMEGEIVGQLMVTYEWSDWRNGPIWWIQSVYVRPDKRRQGVFRRLLQHILQAGRDAGAAGFRLYVVDTNTTAQATYRSLGFSLSQYVVMELLSETK